MTRQDESRVMSSSGDGHPKLRRSSLQATLVMDVVSATFTCCAVAKNKLRTVIAEPSCYAANLDLHRT